MKNNKENFIFKMDEMMARLTDITAQIAERAKNARDKG